MTYEIFKNFSVYSFGRFLYYNIMDCIAVIEILEAYQYTTFFDQIVNMYPSNLDFSLHSNMMKRFKILFDSACLEYGEFPFYHAVFSL